MSFAKECHARADRVANIKADGEYKMILRQIESAVDNGKTSVNVDIEYVQTIFRLRKEDFDVFHEHTHYKELKCGEKEVSNNTYKISW